MILKKNYFIYLFIFVLLVAPWFNSSADQIDYIPELSQEANPFYEINPCKISLIEFFNANRKSLYQDHYFFRANNDSAISCFGKISGISVQQNNLQTQFFISVGTNSLINLLLQGSIWLLLLSFVDKSPKKFNSYKYFHNISIVLTAYLITFSIFAQQRFYDESFYLFDLNKNSSYILIFLIFLLLTKNLVEVYLDRSAQLFNMLPFVFLITGIFSGYNIVFFSIIYLYSGICSIFERTYKSKLIILYISLSFWWLINSNGSFYFNPGKFRGFTNSVYEFNSNLYWIAFFLLLLLGIFRELKNNVQNFELSKFTKYFSNSSSIILLTGLISSNFPSLNFFTSYYLGLQRNVVELTNPFAFDEFGVKISWRGISPSSETIGEFFGICLLLNFFEILQKSKLEKYNYIGVIFSGIGLYFSDNRTSIVIIFFVILFLFIKYLKPQLFTKVSMQRKILLTVSLFGLLYFFIQSETYDFYSESLISNSRNIQYDSIFSSFLILLNNSFEQGNVLYYIFGFFSAIGYLLNRSEMWGIFFARYNPTINELLVGSGPLTLGQLYGEIKIDDLTTFLLPHSSFLSYIVYFGVLPVVYLLYKLFKLMRENKENFMFLSLSIFILLNVFKNDSLNYFSSFLLYYFLLFIFNKRSFSTEKS
jgi:hypothetical protein